ncbi:altered inheritance of mitochondria protein 32-like [Carex rostrata]
MKRVPLPHLLSRRRFSTSSTVETGFSRPEFGRERLVGTVQPYDRHVFLHYGLPTTWHSHVEAEGGLPRSLSLAIKARQGEMKKKTRLTIHGGADGASSTSSGDILIFPDMTRYRNLSNLHVDDFVEEVLVKEANWQSSSMQILNGSYIFVCSHGTRDQRCGFCGTALVNKFEEDIAALGLVDKVYVSPCSHIGGHKYAGNVIIYDSSFNGESTGHWYGYVSPGDVPVLLEQHVRGGKIVEKLWRGQMGLSREEQKKAQELRLQLGSEIASRKHG